MVRIPPLSEIIYKELQELKGFSKEDIEKMVEYKKLKSWKCTEDFLKRHAEAKKRFQKEIKFNVGEYILISPDYPQKPYF